MAEGVYPYRAGRAGLRAKDGDERHRRGRRGKDGRGFFQCGEDHLLFGGYERFLERIESEDKEKSYSTRVIKVIRFIRQNYEKDISVGDAAQLLGLNGEYLNKLFKKETGESFSRYLTQIRMEKAKELLESGQFNVSEVSARTGYKSSQYFSITFRRYMGYSPSEAEAHKGD